MTHVVIYSDRFGRVSHAVTSHPARTLAELVFDGVIAGADRGRAVKAASAARVLCCDSTITVPATSVRAALRWLEFCEAWRKIGEVYARTHGHDDDHESYGG